MGKSSNTRGSQQLVVFIATLFDTSLFFFGEQRVLPVKLAAARTLCVFIRYNRRFEQRQELCCRLIQGKTPAIRSCCFILGFHVTSRHHKIRYHFFDSRNGSLVKLPIFGFLVMPCHPIQNSLYNFGNIEVFELQLLRQNYD